MRDCNFASDDFVEAYEELKHYLEAVSDGEGREMLESDLPPDQKTQFEALLDEMLVEFNDEANEEIYNLYLDWDDTLRLMFEQGRSPGKLLNFFETFVESVSKIALGSQENSDIFADQLGELGADKTEVKEELRKRITRKRIVALEEREYQNSLDAVSDAYNETISDELENLQNDREACI